MSRELMPMNDARLRNQLDRRIQELTPEKRSLLAQRLQQKASNAPSGIQPITRGKGDTFPLSFAQQRLWFLERWEPGNPAYVQLFDLHVTGSFHPDIAERSLNEIIRRHDALRTIFLIVDGEPLQKIQPTLALRLPVTDLTTLPLDARNAEAARIALNDARAPFDLSTGPLIRAQLLKIDKSEYRLLVTQLHIITDAWSLNVLLREFAAIYTSFVDASASALPELQLQYADFAVWQREWLQGKTLQRQLDFWKRKLANTAPIDLPLDHARPPLQTYQGAKSFVAIDRGLAESLRMMCRQEGVTLFILAMAVLKVLIYRYTGETSLSVGSPNANRGRVETEPLLGFFTNTLVMHTEISPVWTFREMLRTVRDTALESYANQDVPFEKLVEELHPERDLSRTPLFQVLFQTISVPTEPIRLPDADLSYHEFDNKTAKFDLTLQVAETQDGLICSCEYNTDLFRPETVARLLDHYKSLLESVVSSPNCSIAALPMLTAPERRQILVDWNTVPAIADDPRTLHALVERWAETAPDAPAVSCQGRTLTYRQLNERANRWAHRLQAHGIGSECPVAVFLDRSVDMIVALLAALKSGGAYVPIDPIYPADRISHILGDIQAHVIITEKQLASRLPASGAAVLIMDDEDYEGTDSIENPLLATSADGLAYIIFTSGSTGRPKGVQITHRSAVHLFESTRDRFEFGPSDTYSLFHSYAFDFSVWEIWAALTSGGRLVIVPTSATQTPRELFDLILNERVSVLNLTPSAMRALNDERLSRGVPPPPLRLLICGGEALPGDLVPAISEWKTSIWNFYGPTESTVWCACGRVDTSVVHKGPVALGKPLPDNRLYVLDRSLQPVPVGVPGELHIGGAGLARGYICQPDLTAQKFISDPFSNNSGDRLYKTGDLCRFAPDGTLEFLGRIDHQVKLRGFRIELGEIEAALSSHPGVAAAVAIVREDVKGDPRLAAYVVASHGAAPSAAEIRTHLAASLPEYMVPGIVVFLDSLPLNANGKIDRRALPAPDLDRRRADTEFIAPREELERQLAGMFEQILGVRSVSIHDSFFELGGHSLNAVRLFSRIEEMYAQSLALSTLFLAPTVAQLADILRQDNWKSPFEALVPIQPAGSRPIFFCVHGAGREVLFYRDLAERLGNDQPFYGIKARTYKEQSIRNESVEQIAARYNSEMIMLQPEGPYFIGGASLGGIIAFEMAQQLIADGREVAFLAFFDSFHPAYMRYKPRVTRLHKAVFGYYRTLENHVTNAMLLKGKQRVTYLWSKVRRVFSEGRDTYDGLKRIVGKRVYTWAGKPVPDEFEVYKHGLRTAVKAYCPTRLPGKITIFRATRQPIGIYPDRNLGWTNLADEIEIIDIPGFHANIVMEPRARLLVEKMRPALDAAIQSYSSVANAASEPSEVPE